MTVRTRVVGDLGDGTPVHAHTVQATDGGLRVTVLELGATVDSLLVNGADGQVRDVVLGLPTVESRLASTAYLGSTVGRYANRIAGGTFLLDGRRHTVPANEGTNALHGGPEGFDRRLWQTLETTCSSVRLGLVSPDGDQGFPGDLAVEVTFTVTDRTVSIDYSARAAAATVVNLTNHSYFNLDGETSFGVDDHLLTVEADDFLPVAPDLIPQGRAVAVRGPFDLRSPTRVGESVRARDDQLLPTKGIDHHFVVRGSGMRRHARLVGPSSGLRLEVDSDQPGLQVYTGNFLDGSLTGTYGRSYRQGSGIALETQHAPDSPNNPAAPSTVLRPGETYRSTTRWVFSR